MQKIEQKIVQKFVQIIEKKFEQNIEKIIFAKNCANCFANFKKIVQKLRYTVYIEQKVQIHNCAKNYTKNCTKY